MTGMGTAMDIKLTAALAQGAPNVAAFCRDHKISRQTYYKWKRRFAGDGVNGLADRSRRPIGSGHMTPSAVEDEIVWWRKKLADDGEDNGPQTIRYRMLRTDADSARVPSRTTIWRVLARRGLIIPERRSGRVRRCDGSPTSVRTSAGNRTGPNRRSPMGHQSRSAGYSMTVPVICVRCAPNPVTVPPTGCGPR